MTETLEHTARKIAEHGREALVARLRPAFAEAAAAHRDVLELDDQQLENMVQSAADRADGLQWRRALASVATEQLGIGLGEALAHPAVARAQAIVGAPSYEEALGAVGATARETPETEAEPAAAEEPETEAELEDDPPPPAADLATGEFKRPEPEAAAEPEAELPAPARWDDDEQGELRLRAVHLGGIANLGPTERDIELHISDAGLDIVRGPERTPLGRLTWKDILALDTPPASGRFRRRRGTDTHLVVRSAQGSASFEIPGITPDELREHLAPVVAAHQQ